MAGLDRETGRPISNFQSALQGVQEILVTPRYSRVMRREFGFGIQQLLGQRMTPSLFAAFIQLVIISIDRWEPRFRVRTVTFGGSPEQVRAGKAKILIEADYRPKAHLKPPDYTPERTVSFGLLFDGGKVITSSA